ncbi:hypothetical protein J23TS9_02730 [Paenibacillus sp. J23TS9]|uniref:hypothetical protein n=1 Tax=Paenibacillus sp. J23TS9 TaxID=2807193 RepID=UPI001B265B5D|nr:hypothetical protein [Paenibacillus sp. J23TS9]GIP25143.1 hypothetical protein J23TS9_02730 [Paenibacillus sp. J23TS9]
MDDFHEHEEHEQHERERQHASRRIRRDYPRRDDHEEEYAAEVAPPRSGRYEISQDDDEDREKERTNGRTAGYVGLAFGIASLFMWSIVLGPIAAVTGYYAYSQGSKVWGAWGMGLGILATISYFVLIPFAR